MTTSDPFAPRHPGRETEPSRLDAGLRVLRVVLPAYLGWLRAGWDGGSEAEEAPGADGIGPLVRSMGCPLVPTDGDLAEVSAALSCFEVDDASTFSRVADALGLDPVEQFVVAAVHWAEVDQHVATLLGCVHDDGARRYASLTALRALLTPFGVRPPVTLEHRHPLVAAGVLFEELDPGAPLRLTPTARTLFADRPMPTLAARGPLPERLADVVDQMAAHLASADGGAVAVRGPRGVGRRTLAAEAVLAAGLWPVPGDRPVPELVLLGAVGSVPIVEPGEPLPLTGEAQLERVILILDPDDQAPPEVRLVIDVQRPDARERARLWAERLAVHGGHVDQSGINLLASRFRLHDADIDAVVERAAADAASRHRPLDLGAAWTAARGFPQHGLDAVAELVTPEVGLDDLVLSPEIEGLLRGVIDHVTLQHQVMEEWGFRGHLARGAGVVAMFAGPPGTGKTMAAEAVAAELEQDLWRVDLSCVVSKYVGETEKNLAAAFDGAEAAGAVLFFDEADSLFGKRTEVKEAHDRYANLEVNYLLQRVETFTGLVVLATNRESAMDEAFLRRLRFVVRFELPDPVARGRIWRRAFPVDAGAVELPWDRLAQLELTGGNIQAIALHAAFAAAADHRTVELDDVLVALDREHVKLGRAWRGLPGTRGES